MIFSFPRREGQRKPGAGILSGFSLVEMLVAVSILAILTVLLLSLLNSGTTLWRRSAAKIQTFQEARAAYEALTRKISQATLNTYWDYEMDSQQNPVNYKRQSELAFVSGPASALLPSLGNPRTHAVFFQAPLGYSAQTNLQTLSSLLNSCGYFLEFGTDAADRPPFLQGNTVVPERPRFRLKELWEPSENLAIYNATPPSGWISTSPSSTISENIIALVVVPKLPPKEDPTGASLLNNFTYDSTDATQASTVNQLPPLVQVVMVAIDESSAKKFENGSTPPDYGIDWNQVFQDPTNLADDIKTVEAALAAQGINYQVFNSTIPIEGAKWSR